jgi:transposase
MGSLIFMANIEASKTPSPAIQLRNAKRQQAVAAVQQGECASLVARVMNIPQRTLFKWLADYRAGGVHALLEGNRSGRPRKVSSEVMKWLYDAITLGDPRQFQLEFSLWSLNIVRSLLNQKHDIKLSKSGASRLLAHLGLSPQRPIYKSYKRDPEEMKKYLDETFPGIRELAKKLGAQIYFVDESAVRSDSHRGTTWGIIGETPEVQDTGDRFSLKLISAVSPRGDMKFSCFEGYMNADRFIEFIKRLLSDAGCPIIVIADNATYHRTDAVKELAAKSNNQITIRNLPRYSPELNPDEQVWNHAKSRLSKLFISTKAEFKESLMKIMFSIQRSANLVRSFFMLKTTRYAAEV